MYAKMLTLALIVSSLTSVSSLAQTKDQAAVGQAVDQLRSLMIDPDKAKLEALTASQLTYGHSSGKLEDKTAFIDALVSGVSDFVTIDLTDQTITVVDNVALVRHHLMADTHDNGKANKANLNVLLIWIKQKGNWQLLARQAVKVLN